MFIIPVLREDVKNDMPDVYQQWLDVIKIMTKTEINEEKLQLCYSCGFFVSKNAEKLTDMYEKSLKMLYPERLELELSKVRVVLAMKYGDFSMTNKLEKGTLPKTIKTIVSEITKVKMTIEAELHNDEDIKDSIPELDPSVISVDVIKDAVKGDHNYDLDDILDKISNKGLDSLSSEEKEFLDKKSKNI